MAKARSRALYVSRTLYSNVVECIFFRLTIVNSRFTLFTLMFIDILFEIYDVTIKINQNIHHRLNEFYHHHFLHNLGAMPYFHRKSQTSGTA